MQRKLRNCRLVEVRWIGSAVWWSVIHFYFCCDLPCLSFSLLLSARNRPSSSNSGSPLRRTRSTRSWKWSRRYRYKSMNEGVNWWWKAKEILAFERDARKRRTRSIHKWKLFCLTWSRWEGEHAKGRNQIMLQLGKRKTRARESTPCWNPFCLFVLGKDDGGKGKKHKGSSASWWPAGSWELGRWDDCPWSFFCLVLYLVASCFHFVLLSFFLSRDVNVTVRTTPIIFPRALFFFFFFFFLLLVGSCGSEKTWDSHQRQLSSYSQVH